MKKVTFIIIGMDCAACAISIDGDLEEQEGITKAKTNYAKSQTEVTFDPKKVTESDMLHIIKKAGYSAKLQ
jgi:copper chaperone CopZ